MAAHTYVEITDSMLDEELEVLESIYIHELTVERDESGRPYSICLDLHPSTGDDLEKQYVCMTLIIMPTLQYPVQPPWIQIKNPRGISEDVIQRVMEAMHELAEDRKGGPMLYELTEIAKECLTESNIPHGPCAICLGEFTEGDPFMKTECYHHFHHYCLARYIYYVTTNQEEEDDTAPPGVGKEEDREEGVVCPVCRLSISYDLELLEQAKEPVAKEMNYIVTKESQKHLSEMAKVFARQKANGGIIDLEAEKNKYLVPKDLVISVKTPADSSADENRPDHKNVKKNYYDRRAERKPGQDSSSSRHTNQGRLGHSHHPRSHNPHSGNNSHSRNSDYSHSRNSDYSHSRNSDYSHSGNSDYSHSRNSDYSHSRNSDYSHSRNSDYSHSGNSDYSHSRNSDYSHSRNSDYSHSRKNNNPQPESSDTHGAERNHTPQTRKNDSSQSDNSDQPQSRRNIEQDSERNYNSQPQGNDNSESEKNISPQSKRNDKPQHRRYDNSQSERNDKPQHRRYDNPQSERNDKPQHRRYDNSQSERNDKPQHRRYDNSQSERNDKPQHRRYDNPQSERNDKPQHRRYDNSQSERNDKPQHRRYDNPQSERNDKPQHRRYDNPQSERNDKPQHRRYDNSQSERNDKPQHRRYDNPQSERNDKPQHRRYDNSQSEINDKPQHRRYDNSQSEINDKPQHRRYDKSQSERNPDFKRRDNPQSSKNINTQHRRNENAQYKRNDLKSRKDDNTQSGTYDNHQAEVHSDNERYPRSGRNRNFQSGRNQNGQNHCHSFSYNNEGELHEDPEDVALLETGSDQDGESVRTKSLQGAKVLIGRSSSEVSVVKTVVQPSTTNTGKPDSTDNCDKAISCDRYETKRRDFDCLEIVDKDIVVENNIDARVDLSTYNQGGKKVYIADKTSSKQSEFGQSNSKGTYKPRFTSQFTNRSRGRIGSGNGSHRQKENKRMEFGHSRDNRGDQGDQDYHTSGRGRGYHAHNDCRSAKQYSDSDHSRDNHQSHREEGYSDRKRPGQGRTYHERSTNRSVNSKTAHQPGKNCPNESSSPSGDCENSKKHATNPICNGTATKQTMNCELVESISTTCRPPPGYAQKDKTNALEIKPPPGFETSS